MGVEHLYIVSDPALIRDVLVTHNQRFHKGRGLERAKRVLGNGLLTSEDAVHLRQRRLMQPACHRERIASYGATMVSYAERVRSAWTDGETLDVAAEMSRLTLLVVGKTLFDVDVESQASVVREAMAGLSDSFWTLMLPLSSLIEYLPLPHLRRGRLARARLDAMVYEMIRERRARGTDQGDLLSMLLLAQDHEDHGRRMTDAQVRDEAMTLFLAGHETTANALTWTLHLLGSAPDVERRLHAEIDDVLQGRPPVVADVEHLVYTHRVVTESMRLYPPAWLIGRRAVVACDLGGYAIPSRSIVVTSQWVVHRDERHYPDPARFDPDRWTPEFKSRLAPFAYFPFGGGPRRCIGESFAWMELVLVLATVAQRWRFAPVPDHAVIPQAAVTLRPKGGLPMVARLRLDSGKRDSAL